MEQGGQHEGEHPEEDSEGLPPSLRWDVEDGELDPEHIYAAEPTGHTAMDRRVN